MKTYWCEQEIKDYYDKYSYEISLLQFIVDDAQKAADIMKQMKKVFSIILAAAMILSLAACGGKPAPVPAETPAPTEAPAPAETPAPAPAAADDLESLLNTPAPAEQPAA